jgi:type IX secretion system PorP/SprF family membrane protein
MKFVRYITIGLIMFGQHVFAQQEPQFTQFNENMLYFNPAYAGSKEALNLTAFHRQQWVGFDGRPITSSVSLNTPLSYKSLGFGLSLVNDHLGIVDQKMAFADISYTLKFSENAKLSFGLKGGFNYLSIGNTFNVSNPNDPNLNQNTLNKLNPNFGFGAFFHTKNFFCGLSVPKLIQNSYDGTKINSEVRHYFANIGFVLKLNRLWKLRPVAQVKAVAGAPLGFDFSLAGIYNDKFIIGSIYRLGIDAGTYVQFQLSPKFRAGLAYDFGLNAMRNYHTGSYEAMLSYNFSFGKEGVRSPRYF